jgi:hypothetical protein
MFYPRSFARYRQGHGRSSQPWQGNDLDTYADDLAKLIEKLNIKEAVDVGHSTGGGELAPRYQRVAKASHPAGKSLSRSAPASWPTARNSSRISLSPSTATTGPGQNLVMRAGVALSAGDNGR